MPEKFNAETENEDFELLQKALSSDPDGTINRVYVGGTLDGLGDFDHFINRATANMNLPLKFREKFPEKYIIDITNEGFERDSSNQKTLKEQAKEYFEKKKLLIKQKMRELPSNHPLHFDNVGLNVFFVDEDDHAQKIAEIKESPKIVYSISTHFLGDNNSHTAFSICNLTDLIIRNHEFLNQTTPRGQALSLLRRKDFGFSGFGYGIFANPDELMSDEQILAAFNEATTEERGILNRILGTSGERPLTVQDLENFRKSSTFIPVYTDKNADAMLGDIEKSVGGSQLVNGKKIVILTNKGSEKEISTCRIIKKSIFLSDQLNKALNSFGNSGVHVATGDNSFQTAINLDRLPFGWNYKPYHTAAFRKFIKNCDDPNLNTEDRSRLIQYFKTFGNTNLGENASFEEKVANLLSCVFFQTDWSKSVKEIDLRLIIGQHQDNLQKNGELKNEEAMQILSDLRKLSGLPESSKDNHNLIDVTEEFQKSSNPSVVFRENRQDLLTAELIISWKKLSKIIKRDRNFFDVVPRMEFQSLALRHFIKNKEPNLDLLELFTPEEMVLLLYEIHRGSTAENPNLAIKFLLKLDPYRLMENKSLIKEFINDHAKKGAISNTDVGILIAFGKSIEYLTDERNFDVDDERKSQSLLKFMNTGLSLYLSSPDKHLSAHLLADSYPYNNLPHIHLALQNEANVNLILKKNGRTPLNHALGQENIRAVELLLSYGANSNIKSNDGSTAFVLASKKIHKNSADPILKKCYQDIAATIFDKMNPEGFIDAFKNAESDPKCLPTISNDLVCQYFEKIKSKSWECHELIILIKTLGADSHKKLENYVQQYVQENSIVAEAIVQNNLDLLKVIQEVGIKSTDSKELLLMALTRQKIKSQTINFLVDNATDQDINSVLGDQYTAIEFAFINGQNDVAAHILTRLTPENKIEALRRVLNTDKNYSDEGDKNKNIRKAIGEGLLQAMVNEGKEKLPSTSPSTYQSLLKGKKGLYLSQLKTQGWDSKITEPFLKMSNHDHGCNMS